jgi:uncharacterized membrane protein YphA (DoxX/SURF4 family)
LFLESEKEEMATSVATQSVPQVQDEQNKAVQQAYTLLHLAFVVAPIVAGLDKFTNLLVDWSNYLAPVAVNLLPMSGDAFMYIVGVIEIVAGIVVLLRPRFGGYLVAVWLWGIILNLLLIPGYFDVALRDFGLSLGALALARLSEGLGKQ